MTAPSGDSLPVAVVQAPPVYLDLRRSVDRAVELIRSAAADGAELVAFPETWLPGYPIWLDAAPGAALWDHPPARALYSRLVEQSIALDGDELEPIRKAAEASGADVVIGAHERRGGTLYNSTVLVGRDGDTIKVHRKLVPTYSERLVWGRGDGSTLDVLDTPSGPVGGLICWEHWMPLTRAAMHARGEVVHVAQWPTAKEIYQVASRHYAFEGRCFVLVAGCVLRRDEAIESVRRGAGADFPGLELLESIPGDGDELLLGGGSAIIGPDGAYLAGPIYGEPVTLTAELRLERIREGHLELDTDGHYSRPDVFRLEVDERPQRGTVFRRGSADAEEPDRETRPRDTTAS